ncbi:MAG: sugar phosphate isomerase/epimerase [Clostridia bacterium]|nr:sugar phosphate isomerase/epimerase [Clostridia bacterium]
MKRKTGISTKLGGLNKENFLNYAASGVTAFELSIQLKEHETVDLDRICREAREAGVETWSYHLPFYPFEVIDPASLDASVRRHTVEHLSFLIKRAASHGFLHAVIHPSGEPIADADREKALEYSRETLYSLAEVAKESGIILAVEDLPRTCLGNCSAELLSLVNVHPDLRVCFDVNHLLFESHGDFLRAVKDKLVTVHISDYDFINERHWLPGEGKIDWFSFLSDLDEAGYTGVFMYEVPAEAGNIIRPRPLVPADYAQNHACLCAGINPTPLGTPKI